tara:strand:+ start:683 stop:1081 length:399 start_codon:yes stop_codon:yes gene_type:complete
MLTLVTVTISLFLIILTGWTLTTYFRKKDSQAFIREELTNLFDICKKFFESIKNLIGILVSNSLSSESNETNPAKETVLTEDEQLLNLVQPVKEVETTPFEMANEESDVDAALSSFSAEVVEVINQEEEKVA